MQNNLKQNVQITIKGISIPDDLVMGENMNSEVFESIQTKMRYCSLLENIHQNLSPKVKDCVEFDLKILIASAIEGNIRNSIHGSQEKVFRTI